MWGGLLQVETIQTEKFYVNEILRNLTFLPENKLWNVYVWNLNREKTLNLEHTLHCVLFWTNDSNSVKSTDPVLNLKLN